MFYRMDKSLAFGLLCVLPLFLLIGELGLGQAPAQTQPRTEPLTGHENILILHALEANMPLNVGTDRAIVAALEAGGIGMKDQFFEYLDLQRNPGVKHRQRLAEMLRLRYGKRKIDLIITLYPEALQFMLDEGQTIAFGAPIVALYMFPGFEPPKTGRRIIQHVLRSDMTGTLEIALKLVPEAKHVYVVGGVHPLDKKNETQARQDLKKWEGQLDFRYLSGLSVEGMLATVSSAPPNTIIFYLAVTTDITGNTYNPRDVVERLSQVSKAPVFGLYETLLGHGIVGGSLFSYAAIGTQAGQSALKILRGNRMPRNISPILDVSSTPMFDWRELRRWNLNPDALPKGSIIVNREFMFWDFRYYIILCLALVMAEAALIIVLIVQGRHKKVAEEALRKAEEKYRNIFNSALEGIFETSPQGEPLTANPALARMLGYDSPAEVTSTIGDTGSQVWVDSNERLEYIRQLEAQDVVRGFECRFLRKDGKKIWVSLNTRRVHGPDGGTLYYTGFIEDVTERKQAEEEIRKSETKYRSLHESMMDGFVLVSMNGMIREYNESYRQMTGYTPEELLKLTYRNLTPEKWHGFEQKVIEQQVLAQGYSEVYEKEYRKKDGTILPVELRTFLIKDETGSNSGMWAIVRDITERRSAEAALRESNERFRQVAENVADFIWEVDANGLYRYTSPSVEKILGYRPDELIGKMHFYDLFAPEVREELKAAALKVFTAKQSFRAFPNPNVSKEGKVVHLETSGTPVLDTAGNLVGYRGADSDVTERRQAEGERQRLAAAVEHTGEAVYIMDARFTVNYVNPAFTRLTGYSWDEIVGRDASVLRSDKEADTLYENLRRKLESGRFWTDVYPIRHKDGAVSPARVSASSIRDASGTVTNYVVVCHDITEQQKLEVQLRQIQKMEALGTLTGGIAHDFNNILAAMMGFTELAKEKFPKGSTDERHLQMVLDAGIRGRELIRQLLAFSRQSAPEKKPLQLSDVVKETAGFLRASIPSTVSIRVNIESESGLILGDPVQIQQVLMNLCANAAQAMKEKGGILDLELSDFSVSASDARLEGMNPGLYAKLVVRDTGIGMPPEVIDRIFDPFFTTKKYEGGTGLGLSVVHGIVRQHDGHITVESLPGKGSTFTVYLPQVAERAKAGAVSEETMPTGHERVLLVDDEQALVETGRKLLEGLGYEVTARNSSVEALKLFGADPARFDLVVTDQTMPDMTGLELAKACMALRPDIPVVLATGFSHLVDATTANEAGIRAFIMKPLTKGELARTVRKVLDG